MLDYARLLQEQIVIFDGATGTNLQLLELTADDFGGEHLEGCNEVLVRTKPEVIQQLHASFLEVGVDVIETDSFGALAPVLAEYGLASEARELNEAAARLAVGVAKDFSTPNHPRYVAGSMGPGTKLPTLGQIDFETLADAYHTQASGLIAGGVDLLVIETVYDLLSAKAAMIGARRAMQQAGRLVPLQLQVTIELTGRMLPGTEIGAALASLSTMQPTVFGINCATGPTEMSEHLRYLAEHSPLPISCLPNAGLPSVQHGKMHYDLTPDQLASSLKRFVQDFGVNTIGGCCGTTPTHLKAVVEACRDLSPQPRHPSLEPEVASLYSPVSLHQDTSLVNVGERTNANGSKRFREALLAADYDTCVAMAQEQVRDGAHLIDLCVDYTGEDGVHNMGELAARLATAATLPIMLDSTEAEVIEVALTHLGGRTILNSVNLEEGDAKGSRLDKFLTLAKRFGAAVVATCIDEDGQARTPEWKLKAATSIASIAITRYGLTPADLIFDPLVLPITTGMEESRQDAKATIEGIRLIHQAFPESHTIIGLSNISFGLKPAAREVLNSVFLEECRLNGLSMAILHPSKIIPLAKIPEEIQTVCLDLIYDRRRDGYDPLSRLIELFESTDSLKETGPPLESLPLDERLYRRIVDGNRVGLEADLQQALDDGKAPLAIVNDILLAAMAEVGELFGSGQMQLPFVLASAETMKQAVAYLEPFMDRADATNRGTIVLATVKGDVHDIGKNLVDIILTNNGFSVHNLGIKVAANELIEKAVETNADAIGMSGLLVKSTLVMRDNLLELNDRGLSHIPVILGGAALTRSFVERDLREIYHGRVFYGKDAFEGLEVLDKLVKISHGEITDDQFGRQIRASSVKRMRTEIDQRAQERTTRSEDVPFDNPIYTPPFLGTRVVKGISLEEIATYLNETALFRHQWGYRPQNGEPDSEFKERIRQQLAIELAHATTDQILIPQLVYGYFPCNSDGNDLIIWDPIVAGRELSRFQFPRQPKEPYLCIADFYRPLSTNEVDYVAFHVVTMGKRVSEVAQEYFQDNRYQDYLHLHGLGVEMTEALAELWHARIRREWGFGDEDGPTLAGLFKQAYRGGRYSWGYPACPNLEDNEKLVAILEASRIGVVVSENFQLDPEQTTTAIIAHHPMAKYFIA
ncbi:MULTISPECIES: methionine synthase [Ferrimicrobium]|uniref:methionine synthase n=1 Tax=Ferrimicrobium TaxID=121038 RepID=UPI0023F29A2A|nr:MULTISPECIES: methionine synthase [Ferrimicrobium]